MKIWVRRKADAADGVFKAWRNASGGGVLSQTLSHRIGCQCTREEVPIRWRMLVLRPPRSDAPLKITRSQSLEESVEKRKSQLPRPGSADKGAVGCGEGAASCRGVAFGRAMMPFFAKCCFGTIMCNSNARDWPTASWAISECSTCQRSARRIALRKLGRHAPAAQHSLLWASTSPDSRTQQCPVGIWEATRYSTTERPFTTPRSQALVCSISYFLVAV
jgi:hypothetical protein